MPAHTALRWQIILIVTMFVWASQYVAAKHLLQYYAPETIALYRMVLAGATLGIIYSLQRTRVRISKRNRWLILLTSIVGAFMPALLVLYGIKFAGATVASILMNTSPFFVAIVAGLLAMERFNYKRLIGIAIGVLGVAMVLLRDGSIMDIIAHAQFKGAVFALLAAMGSAIFAVIGKKVIPQIGGLTFSLFTIIPAALVLATICLLVDVRLFSITSWPDFAVFLYVGIVSSAMVWWIFAVSLNHLDASHAITYKLLIPPFAAVFAFLLFQEKLSLLAYLGMAVISLGIYFVSQAGKKSAEEENIAQP